jgi:RND family efflux transporter MFP subunit
MKYTIQTTVLALGLAAISCSPSDPRKQVDAYKKKINEYEQKIEEIESLPGNITAGNEGQQAITVEVTEVEPRRFSRYFEVTGLMESEQDATISSEISGRIEEIRVKRGQKVAAGQLLVRLNSELTEKSIAEVRTSLELATRLYEKQEELWEKQIGSEIQYLEAKNSKEVLEARLATLEKQLAMARITAPFPGIVEAISVEVGELASPGMPMLRLVNLDRMRVTSRISESYLNQVKEGDEVELQFAAYPDLIIPEEISRLGQVIDPQTRTITLEVELKNRDGKLKPNMLTAVRIEDYRNERALVVPSIILREDFNGTFLYRVVPMGEGMVTDKVYVETGITVQDRTEIISGLSEGDRVIVKGYHLVGDGTMVITANG